MPKPKIWFRRFYCTSIYKKSVTSFNKKKENNKLLSYYSIFFCSPSSLPNWGKYIVSFCPKCLRVDVK